MEEDEEIRFSKYIKVEGSLRVDRQDMERKGIRMVVSVYQE